MRAPRGRLGTFRFVLEPCFDPPYVAVIFSSVRTAIDDDGYAATADDMERLARDQPGYLGIESARDPATRTGITVSYWRTAQDATAWKRVAEHAAVQRLGRERWYAAYRVRVATVERDEAFDRD